MPRFEQYYERFHELLQENYCLNLQENLKVFNFIYNSHAAKTPVETALIEFATERHLIKKK